MRLAVGATPRAGRDEITGWAKDPGGRAFLKVKVSAPAVDGAANAALIILIAKTLGRPKSAVRIVSGETARLKMLEVEGASEADFAAAFGPIP